MTKDEALDLALEALQEVYWSSRSAKHDEAITAIKQARSAPVQEPVAWMHDCAALLQNDVELWVDRCPHCGKPRITPPAATAQEKTTMENNGGKTGWPPGLLQDDNSRLSKWFAGKPDARQKVREAAAPVQCWKCGDMDAEFQAYCKAPACGMKETAAPVQEPVAWRYKQRFLKPHHNEWYYSEAFPDLHATVSEPLYTTPPAAQRQWVGLTDESVVSAAARVLSDRVAASCNVDCGDMWMLHGNDSIEDARAMLEAAMKTQHCDQCKHAIKQARSAPVQPNQYGVEFGMHGEKMMFKVGVQQFTLDYKPDTQDEFNFMRGMLVHAFSTFTPDVKTAPPARPAPVQEPDYKALYEKAAQQYNELAALMDQPAPVQEPVTWGVHDQQKLSDMLTAQRQWVGLTDGDIAQTMHGSVEGSNMLPYQFARAIEAKLKEKNHD